jgi:hypothetical protein
MLDPNDPKMNDIMRRIRALKIQAEDKGTTEAEALTFANKVSELLAKYNLEEAQLDLKHQEDIGHEDYASNWNASPARRALAIAVCRLYYVKPLIRRKKGQPWSLVGRKHNIIEAKDMTEYLIRTTLRLGSQWGRVNPGEDIVDFKRGCFARLIERITEMYLAQASSTSPVWKPSGNPGNLPALYRNEEKLMADYVHRVWPHAGIHRAKIIERTGAAIAGRAAGDKISLSRQVSGNNSHLLPKK